MITKKKRGRSRLVNGEEERDARRGCKGGWSVDDLVGSEVELK